MTENVRFLILVILNCRLKKILYLKNSELIHQRKAKWKKKKKRLTWLGKKESKRRTQEAKTEKGK